MRRLAVLLAAGALTVPVAAQSPAAEALAVVQRLFDAMHAKDSVAIAATFAPGAALLGYDARGGTERMTQMAAADFARRIAGIPANMTIEERIWDAEVRVDDNLAMVWTPYAFVINGTISHCGVDAVLLLRFQDGWKIASIADTRRTEGCSVPAR